MKSDISYLGISKTRFTFTVDNNAARKLIRLSCFYHAFLSPKEMKVAYVISPMLSLSTTLQDKMNLKVNDFLT